MKTICITCKADCHNAGTLSTLRAENANLRKERDAAVEQLHGICGSCSYYTPYHNRGKCASCVHEIVRDIKITPSDHWKWCGPQED